MKPFVYSALPSRVIFGSGTLSQLSPEIQRLGCSKALVLTTPQQVDAGDKVVSLIGDLAVGLYTNATMHTVRFAHCRFLSPCLNFRDAKALLVR